MIALLVACLNFTSATPIGAAYYTGTYPDTHWALRMPDPADDNFVGLIATEKRTYAVVLHPFDRRGYRSIVRLIDYDMASTLNRPYSAAETRGLYHALALTALAYERLGLIPQTLVLGNNAHAFDPVTCAIALGSAEEPSLLHGHVLGRGDPGRAYAGGAALGGPTPGEVFAVRDRGHPWNPDERARVAAELANALKHVKY